MDPSSYPINETLSAGDTIRPSVLETTERVRWFEQQTDSDAINLKHRTENSKPFQSKRPPFSTNSLCSSSYDSYYPFNETFQNESYLTQNHTTSNGTSLRCNVCTLPYGSCVHTMEWFANKNKMAMMDEFASQLDQELADVLDGLTPDEDITTMLGNTKVNTGPAIESSVWRVLEERPIDAIGADDYCLSAPRRRMWHTSTLLGDNLVVFGGLKHTTEYGDDSLPPMGELLNDLCLYDTAAQAWYTIEPSPEPLSADAAAEVRRHRRTDIWRSKGRPVDTSSSSTKTIIPSPRYGHGAAALDENHLVVYGGRGALGTILNDTWVFSLITLRWKQICNTPRALQRGLMPAPCFFTALCHIPAADMRAHFQRHSNKTCSGEEWENAAPNRSNLPSGFGGWNWRGERDVVLESISSTNNDQPTVPAKDSTDDSLSSMVAATIQSSKSSDRTWQQDYRPPVAGSNWKPQLEPLTEYNRPSQLIHHDLKHNRISVVSVPFELETVRLWNRVAMFGGTDGSQVFRDLWVLQCDFGEFYWEYSLAPGNKPDGRYGHQMHFLPPNPPSPPPPSTNTFNFGVETAFGGLGGGSDSNLGIGGATFGVGSLAFPYLLVVGGCGVAPDDERVGTIPSLDPSIASSLRSTKMPSIVNRPLEQLRKLFSQYGLISDGDEFINSMGDSKSKIHTSSTSSIPTTRSTLQKSSSRVAGTLSIQKSSQVKDSDLLYEAEISPEDILAASLEAESMVARFGTKRLEEMLSQVANGSLEFAVTVRQLADFPRAAALLTAALHQQARLTRAAEQQTADQYKLAIGMTKLRISQARHKHPYIDISYLNLHTMMWEPQNFPQVTGPQPPSRAHFCSALLPPYLFITGGLHPTSLTYTPADSNGDRSSTYRKNLKTVVYTLDLRTNTWTRPQVAGSAAYQSLLYKQARTDVIRARDKFNTELSRGRSLGILNGNTREAAAAQIFLNVCEWRLKCLSDETNDRKLAASKLKYTRRNEFERHLEEIGRLALGPRALFGASFTAVGQRMILIGGNDRWGGDGEEAEGLNLVLCCESEDARIRREKENYFAMLERERAIEERKANIASLISASECREENEKQRINNEREWREMQHNDFLSSLPPLSVPSAVTFLRSNEHSIWVTWPQISQDSQERPLAPDTVIYFLYIQIGFEQIFRGDRVNVLVSNATTAVKGVLFNDKYPAYPETQYFDDVNRRFPGIVTASWSNGTFDIKYDDNTTESNVPRNRIRRIIKEVPYERPVMDPQPTVYVDPSWQLVYTGPYVPFYACTSLVPYDVWSTKEKYRRVPVKFAYQTLGADVPLFERSQLSRPVILHTTCPSPPPPIVASMMVTPLLSADGIISSTAILDEPEQPRSTCELVDTMGLSRTRKEIVTAIVNDRVLQIERRAHVLTAEGRGEEFD